MNRTKPLKAKTGLKRKNEMGRGKGFGSPRAPRGTSPRRETGFPARVKLAVRVRAGNGDVLDACCEACGTWLGRYGGEIQHRIARGAGGCRDQVINGPANAALLCGSAFSGCHGRAESRDDGMRHDGFWIRHGKGPEFDPRLVPVLLHSPAGSGVLVWLSEDGEYLFERPEAVA